MARRALNLILVLLILPTSACFKTKANWNRIGGNPGTGTGQKADDGTPITVPTTMPAVAHGYSVNIPITGGSGTYSCSFVSTASLQGSLAVAGRSCTYAAPESGTELFNIEVRVRDEKYPSRTATTLITVPASGKPDATFGTQAVGGPLGQSFIVSSGHAYVYAMDFDPQGNILLGGTSSGLINGNGEGFIKRLSADGTIDPLFATGGTFTVSPSLCFTTSQRQVVSIKSEKGNNAGMLIGIRETQSGVKHAIFRLDQNGNIDTSWGSSGCVVFGNTISSPVSFGDASTLAIATDNSSFVSFHAPGPSIGIRRIDAGGAISSHSMLTAPGGYTFNTSGRMLLAFYQNQSGSQSSWFAVTPYKKPNNLKKGLGFFELDTSSPTSVTLGTTYINHGGFAFVPEGNDIGFPYPEIHAFFIDPLGQFHVGFHANDTASWLGLTKLQPIPNVSYLGPTSQDFTSGSYTTKLISAPQNSPVSAMPPVFSSTLAPLPIGSFGSAVQSNNGGVITVGGADDSSHTTMPTISRYLSNALDGGDALFSTARKTTVIPIINYYNGDVQLPLDDMTGFISSFQACLIQADGKIVVAGAFTKTGFNSGNSVGWISRYWP